MNRRIATIEEIKKEVKALEEFRNNRNATINRHFTNDDARIKLRRFNTTFNEWNDTNINPSRRVIFLHVFYHYFMEYIGTLS